MAFEFLLLELKHHIHSCIICGIEPNEIVIPGQVSWIDDTVDGLLGCDLAIRKLFKHLFRGPADDRCVLRLLIFDINWAV